MTFLLPPELPPDAALELERAWVAAGPDRMPWPTEVQVELNRLLVQRHTGESGCLVAPWDIDGAGRLMGTSATLMERPLPYHFLVEMARGKINQLRCQAAEWLEDGLVLPASVEELIHNANRAFSRAVVAAPSDQADTPAHAALSLSYRASAQLVQAYVSQVFQIRRQNQPRLETALGCRVGTPPLGEAADALVRSCNSICLPFTWGRIEPHEGGYDWSSQDALLEWAESQGLAVTGGPLVDFSSAQLPDWLWLWERDLTSLANFLANYISAALKRYGGRIHRWHLTNAGNVASVLSLSEHELLWLTVKAARVARQIDPGLELIMGVAQPWCDYLAREDREQSPFLFAETLARELNPAALDLEVIMGVTPRGSYCRDPLETSRMLDSYAGLGVPLRVTLGYPSGSTMDPKADPELCVGAGHWHGGYHAEAQAEWAAALGGLALCKPTVQAVNWVHFSDGDLHQFPHCGLLDTEGKPKAALRALRQLRDQHLR